MKKKFREKNKEFFLQRPFNEEWLQYAASDVEDLIDVR